MSGAKRPGQEFIVHEVVLPELSQGTEEFDIDVVVEDILVAVVVVRVRLSFAISAMFDRDEMIERAAAYEAFEQRAEGYEMIRPVA